MVAVCSALHNDTNEIEAPLLEMVAMDKEMAVMDNEQRNAHGRTAAYDDW